MRPIPTSYRGPGLVDLQLNGYAGFDFNSDPESWSLTSLHEVRESMYLRGVVAALPTFITDEPGKMIARVKKYVQIVRADTCLAATFPKLHIEGPFISPYEGPRGAHPATHCLTPNDQPDFLDQLLEASQGRMGILTLAPELPGACALISRAAASGICVAIGHTQASADIIHEAVDAGARFATHLGNGSHQMLPRLDNYIQVQLAEDRLAASFIADGHHMPYYTLQNFLRAKTFARSILVTDAIAAADRGPGHYRLAGEIVEVSFDLRVAKPGQKNLSGSALTLDNAVLNVCRHCGVPFEKTWAMASTQPAALVGLPLPQEIAVNISRDGMRLTA